MTNQAPRDGLLFVNNSHPVMTTGSRCIIWHHVYNNDGEHKQSSVLAVPHQYLQVIPIVSLPRGVIQAMLSSLSHLRTQQWKSIVFHETTKDVVCRPCCISQDEFNQQLRGFHYSVAQCCSCLFCLISLTGMCQTFLAREEKNEIKRLCEESVKQSRFFFRRREKLGQLCYRCYRRQFFFSSFSWKVTCLNSQITYGTCGQGK